MTTTDYLDDLHDELEAFDPDEATNHQRLAFAQLLLRTAIALAEEVADATRDTNARAYWVDQAKVLAGADHGFLDSSFNLDAWMARLNENE